MLIVIARQVCQTIVEGSYTGKISLIDHLSDDREDISYHKDQL